MASAGLQDWIIPEKETIKTSSLLFHFQLQESHSRGSSDIEGFPTKIIIDPKGNIVEVIIGEDPAFYTLLDQLFK